MKYGITTVEMAHSDALEMIEFLRQFIDNADLLDLDSEEGITEPIEIDNLIDCELKAKFYSYYDPKVRAPNPEELKSRDCRVKLTFTNNQGSEVLFNVLGERFYNEKFKKMQTRTPIDLVDELEKLYVL